MNKKRWSALILVLIFIISVIRNISNNIEEKRDAASYAQAITYLKEEQFEEAVEVLQSLADKGYKDSDPLIRYARASLIDEEDVDGRISAMNTVTDFYDGDMAEEIQKFRKSVYAKRDAIYAKEKAKLYRELRDRARKGIPYVGMSTNYINETYLGPCTEESSKPYAGDKKHETLEYKYVWKYKGKVYLVATAVKGSVDSVTKYIGGNVSWEGDYPVFNDHGSSYSASGSYYNNDNSVDADDHDLDMYYYDYADDYENIEDAWDGFEDDEDAWDDY